MAQYKYSRDDYYRLTNAPCIDVALALGMEINERASDQKAWKIKDEQGLCIYREGNNWYRFSDGRHGFSIDLVIDKLGCSREQALDFIAKNVVNGVSEQVCLDHKAPANVKKEIPIGSAMENCGAENRSENMPDTKPRYLNTNKMPRFTTTVIIRKNFLFFFFPTDTRYPIRELNRMEKSSSRTFFGSPHA